MLMPYITVFIICILILLVALRICSVTRKIDQNKCCDHQDKYLGVCKENRELKISMDWQDVRIKGLIEHVGESIAKLELLIDHLNLEFKDGRPVATFAKPHFVKKDKNKC